MSSRGLKRQQSSGRQIVIEEQQDDNSEVEGRYRFQQDEDDVKYHYFQQKDHQKLGLKEGLKINKDKLLRYDALKQKQNVLNYKQNADKVNKMKYGQSSNVINENVFNKTASIKTLKLIKHKIALSKRLKTEEDKQNELQPFLPKMNLKNTNQISKMNKTTSALNLKQRNYPRQINSKGEFNQVFLNRCNSKNKKSQKEEKDQSDKVSTKNQQTNRSDSRMRQTYNKSASVTKFKNYQNFSQSQIVCNHEQVMSILNEMGQKEDRILSEKKHLEQRILALRNGIEKQTALIAEINKNKRRISTFMTKKEQLSKYSRDGANLSKKKSQNYQTQTKHLEYTLSETNQVNNRINASIEEEKQLIKMYEMVIEEVKSQLKEEKQQKLQLQKKLALTKKNEKSIQSKLATQQATNRQIFRKIYFSLEKWQ